MLELTAITACIILAILSVFQIALIAGAPLGNYAWGGSQTTLATPFRIGSAIAVGLYIIFAIIILNKAEMITLFSDVTIAMWVLTIYFSIGVLMNGISRSKKERAIMTPVSLLLAFLSLGVSLQ